MRGIRLLLAVFTLLGLGATGCFKIDHGNAVIFTGPPGPPPPPPPIGNFPPLPPAPPPPSPPPPPAPPPPGPTAWSMAFQPQQESVTDLVAHPQEPGVAFALTGVSLYRTLDTGVVWTQVVTKLAPGGGALSSIAVTGSSVFLGISRDAFGFAGTVAVSTNDGSSFAVVTTLSVAYTVLATSLTSTQTVFAASFATASTPAQIFRSDDAAVTWTSVLSLVPGTQFFDLAVAPTDSRVAVAAVGNSGGVAITQDGGASFSTALAGLPVVCVTISPTSSSTLFAGLSSKEVHRSTDGGANWTKVPTIFTPRTLRVAPSDTTILYAATAADGAFSSPSGGASWFPANLGISQLSLSAVAVDRANALLVFATEGVRVYRTTSGGQ